jgi:hypothetical protein
MIIRFASTASALAVAAAFSAPALAHGPATAIETAAPVVLTEKAAAKLDAASAETLSGVTIAAAKGEAAPVILTATGTAPGLAGGNGDVAVSSAAIAAAAAAVQGDAPTERQERFTVVLNQDAFFGFYPTFTGLIPVSDNVDLSFYGILWTTPSFASTALAGNAPSGSDLWTEFGIGANFILADGKLMVKPQIGLTNGALLSGGVLDANEVPTGTGSNFADGIVPSLTINYSDSSFEAEFYGGYYAALVNRNKDAALDFLHTWVNAGYKFSSNFSAGLHYELLSNTRTTYPGASTARVYQWVGPYVQFTTKNGFFARFTAGADIESGNDGDFYKLAAGWSF